MVAGDNRRRDSSVATAEWKKRQYCGQASDGQAPQGEAVFYSHLDSHTDNVFARQLTCVAHKHKTKAKKKWLEIIIIVKAQLELWLVVVVVF